MNKEKFVRGAAEEAAYLLTTVDRERVDGMIVDMGKALERAETPGEALVAIGAILGDLIDQCFHADAQHVIASVVVAKIARHRVEGWQRQRAEEKGN